MTVSAWKVLQKRLHPHENIVVFKKTHETAEELVQVSHEACEEFTKMTLHVESEPSP
jgi:hypothetical protein